MTRVLLFLSAIAMSSAMSTAIAGEIPERFRQCADIDNDTLRLECYDRSVSGEKAEAAPQSSESTTVTRQTELAAPVAEATPAPPSEEISTAEDRFGLPAELKRDSKDEEPDQISANIAEIEVRRYGHRTFTLDNGQVWAEASANRGLRLQVGDTVTIKSGLFGSYKLFGSGNKSSRVERVR